MERASGVLLHISSLPNEYGIGSFGQSAYEFVDFLVETGQKYWQILPLTTISYGDSPYQSFSAFAGNTHFIDLDVLIRENYLEEADVLKKNFGDQPNKVNYDQVSYERRPLLEKAVMSFLEKGHHKESKFKQFVLDNEHWLIPYCQYMTVKEINNLEPWYRWPEELRNYNKDYITNYGQQHESQMYYHLITQYWFFSQWFELKDYANQHNIQIIGDIPIYVARDSVEMWTQSELFLVDERKNPTVVSGVPPDDFSDDGQHWGNPIYDWSYMKQNDYKWWVSRMKESFKLYDVVRIDHFRGFESYWEIPSGSKTAATGQWKKGPGIDLFKEIKNQLGDMNVIAEDLGFITKEVIDLREQTGFPGMKILQHGFSNTDSPDLIHNYPPNTVAYVGTHDNATALDWYLNYADSAQRDQADVYLNRRLGEHISDALNRGIASSASKMVIYTMQDLLRLGREGRMNIPSTIGNNWDWRMLPDALTNDVKEKLYLWTKTYFRLNEAFAESEKVKVEVQMDSNKLVKTID